MVINIKNIEQLINIFLYFKKNLDSSSLRYENKQIIPIMFVTLINLVPVLFKKIPG